MNENKPIVLLYPPPSDPTQPYSSLPALSGYLRSRGFRVIQKDLGIESLDRILTPEVISEARDSAVARMKCGDYAPEERYPERFYGIIGLSDYIIGNLDEAKALMRDKKLFYDIRRYQWAVTILKLACDLFSLPFHPSRLEPSNYECDVELTFPRLWDAANGKKENIFHEMFEKTVVPDVLAMDPLFVGISVTYHFQIVPAFTLCRLLKAAAPHLHVNVGGAIITDMESALQTDPRWFQFADSFVIGEGETALLTLSQNLLAGRDVMSVPNLISLVNDRPYASTTRLYENIAGLPCPDFDGLDLDRYLSPEPVLLLSSTRGCYYGKCAFCDVSNNTRAVHRQRNSRQLAAEVMEICGKYGTRRLIFCDDAMPPAIMQEIAGLVRNRLTEVTWMMEARFEKILTPDFLSMLKLGGCRLISFGLESASQRVLDAMNKNNAAEWDKKVLQACSDHGIAVNLQTFIGFPTETRDEARETVDFLIKNERAIASFGFGTFMLFKDTPIYKEPGRYGVGMISPNETFYGSCEYVPLSGMTCSEIMEEHARALGTLRPLFEIRGNYLSRAMGAHSLLHFSHYRYDELYRIWKEMEAPHWQDHPDMDDLIVTLSPFMLFSCPWDPTHSFHHRAICSETGNEFSLSAHDQRLVELCDGRRTVGEIISQWVQEQSPRQDDSIVLLARGFAIMREFLRNGLVCALEVKKTPVQDY